MITSPETSPIPAVIPTAVPAAITPEQLLASGRTADVYDLGDGTVLRRYREDRDVSHEARVMIAAQASGLPLPQVVAAQGRDLVLEHLGGPTMLDDALAGRSSAGEVAEVLVDLLAQLAATPVDQVIPGATGDGVLVHHDLHPGNVIRHERGPVIIDWDGARAGRPGEDLAHLVVLLAGAVEDPDIPAALRETATDLALAVLERCEAPDSDLLIAAADERAGVPGFPGPTALATATAWVAAVGTGTGETGPGWTGQAGPDQAGSGQSKG